MKVEEGIYKFKDNGFKSTIYFNKKSYHLGNYDNINEAIEIRKIAENEIRNNNFLKWFENHKNSRKKTIDINMNDKIEMFKILDKKMINGYLYYFVECDCGNKKYIYSGSIKSGATKSCGCMLGKQKLDEVSSLKQANTIRITNLKNQKPLREEKIKGIYKVRDSYVAKVRYKKSYHLGTFPSVKLASKIYKEAKKRILKAIKNNLSDIEIVRIILAFKDEIKERLYEIPNLIIEE